ncbi:right-handed parallel beta-helix repeat-containing protein [Saccharibacillus qingshengii]|uniref:right-handed parallel beta-helix repeat-containing protein n=1 Tax=Saccharibacillus qingshengii TaxID=1763540 RepID=UPI0015580093|nr:right-handed parallel beta-helix repeat-containing protein [Saccharibacillus qingshengii]
MLPNISKSLTAAASILLAAASLAACTAPSTSASAVAAAAPPAAAGSAAAPPAAAGSAAAPPAAAASVVSAAQADPAPYYYVAPDGSDKDGTGAKARPWKTVQRAADAAMKSGGTVYLRGGLYSQRLKLAGEPGAAGSAARLTVASYPSETAVLDGTNLSASDKGSLIELDGASRVTIRGLELRNYKTSALDVVPIGIHVHGAGRGVRLLDNRIHDIGSTAVPAGRELAGRDAHGIAVYGTQAPASISDLTIAGNELYRLTLGSSEALVLNGNVEQFVVENNYVHDNDNIGIDAIGFEGTSPKTKYDQARDGVIRGNLVTGSTSVRNPSYGRRIPNGSHSAGGIYVDGGRDIVIEHNRTERNDIGIEIASEHAGRSTSGITVRSNVVVYNAMTGIALGGYDKDRGSTADSIVTGNTVAYNDTLEWGTGQLYLQFDVRNNIIRNNIFAASASGALILNEYTENVGSLVDYNLYFAPNAKQATWTWKNKTYKSFAAYAKGSRGDTHSLFADPLFAAPASGSFRLQAGSPASLSGIADRVLSAAPDPDGRPRGAGVGGRPSRGAYE